jgi:hypothetical protein
MNNGQVPAKDWPQAFHKRHPELTAGVDKRRTNVVGR